MNGSGNERWMARNFAGRAEVLPATARPFGNMDLLSSSISRDRIIKILTNPEDAADFFRTRLTWLFPPGTSLQECRPTVFRNRVGSSQVVSYRLVLAGTNGQKPRPLNLVIKRYSNKAEGRRIFTAMKLLWENGFDRSSRLTIPEPYDYLDDLGLMVLETVQGELLLKVLPRSNPATRIRMRDVARWLAKLHQLTADSDQIGPHGEDEVSIRDFVRKAGGSQPQFQTRLEELAEGLIGKFAAFKDFPSAKVHGDFQCENVFIHQGRVCVIDFDRICRSDPARDVGYIIAQTRLMGHLTGVLPDTIRLNLEAFWEEYLQQASTQEKETLSSRTCAFAARKCLQNFFYIAYVVPGGRMEALPLLLAETGRFVHAERVEEVLAAPIWDATAEMRKVWQTITGAYGQSITGVYGDYTETAGRVWSLFRDLSTGMVKIAAAEPARMEPLFNLLDQLLEAEVLISGGPADPAVEGLLRAVNVLIALCRVITGLEKGSPEWEATLTEYFRAFEEALSGHQKGLGEAGPAPASAESAEAKFSARVAELMAPAFIEKVVGPVLFGTEPGKAIPLPAMEPFLAQEDRGTGRQTVGYRLQGEVLAFGKRYSSPNEPSAFRVTCRLREAGFKDGPYQVVEHLAYITEHHLLVTRKAPGRPLMDFIGEQGPGVLEKVRRAARWLVRLHESPLRVGSPESLWGSLKLFPIVRRLAKLAAQKPADKDLLLDRIDRLFKKATAQTGAVPPVVQIHGSFHCEHIYLDDERVTVIDFDKSRQGNPAQDLAEFLSLWRRRTFKQAGSVTPAEESTRAFIEEYAAHLPDNLSDLAVYWAGAVFHDLLRYQRRPGDQRAVLMAAFLERDYEAVLAGELIGAAV
ncbi:MAG: aminoglycoside phosphotransferase family protein [Deltaproteobacteria bacterium]|nr:aminoglycoside phosphotransferase family protein [Deltaproteobacteria bacterium]